MAKLLYGASMSLDGFIAGPGGDMSWLTPYFAPDPTMDALPGQIGSLLVGGNTFRGDDPNKGTDKEGAYGGAWHGPVVVVTHDPPAEPVADTTFFTDLDSGVAAAKEAAGDEYVNVLGATIAHSCLDAGVLDEIVVSIVPVMLGDGVRLFDAPGGTHVKLERISLTHGELSTNLWMRVLR